MLPLRDSVRTLRRPYVTWLVIALNAAVFLFSITAGDRRLERYDGRGRVTVSGFEAITLEYGFTPCRLLDRCARPGYGETSVRVDGVDRTVGVRVPTVPALLTLLAAIFMHGGWVHIAGNMLFLWIFGNNVEDAMGRGRFALFYLVCGLAASLTQFAIDTHSDVPNIGASGAIAGVLGAYLLLYPRARVLTVVLLLFFFYVVELPAAFLLLVWFGLQLVDGSAALVAPGQSFGVAYFAHIGGFAAGFVLVSLFTAGRRRPALTAVT